MIIATILSWRRDDRLQPPHPGRVRILGHPAEAGLDRRMVEDDQGRPLRLLGEPRAQPGGAGLAEAAAVPPDLERVEDEDADREVLDRILEEAVRPPAAPGRAARKAARLS